MVRRASAPAGPELSPICKTTSMSLEQHRPHLTHPAADHQPAPQTAVLARALPAKRTRARERTPPPTTAVVARALPAKRTRTGERTRMTRRLRRSPRSSGEADPHPRANPTTDHRRPSPRSCGRSGLRTRERTPPPTTARPSPPLFRRSGLRTGERTRMTRRLRRSPRSSRGVGRHPRADPHERLQPL